MDLQEKLKSLPDQPGVYLFKDGQGTVLYVGKANSLRKRVLTYFPAYARASAGPPTVRRAGRQPSRPQNAKGLKLVRETRALDWVQTGSEAEALLYEASLIKEHQPKYNVSLRDDKSYPFLKVTVEETYPRLYVGRGKPESGIKEIGPFTNATLLKAAFLAIRRVIPFRTCRNLPKRACLDHYLKLCSAPCEGKITPEAYREQLSQVFRLVEGKKEEVVRDLQGKMRRAAGERRYEEAAKFRDQIAGLSHLTVRPKRLIPGEALADLMSVLQLKTAPRRIEGFDISNIFGSEAVGSMVTFVDGRPDKNGYKRFKIRTVAGIDDYAMMQEVLRRRYKRCQAPRVPPARRFRRQPGRADTVLPDLVVIDGGRGHLNAALKVLKELGLNLPAVGIAKEFEQLFLPSLREPIVLSPQSRALQFMQRIRDEAHRFAIGYHKLLRGRRALASVLDEIPGVGPRKRQDLLIRFGSVEAMRGCAVEELMQVRGISEMLAQRIHDHLHSGRYREEDPSTRRSS